MDSFKMSCIKSLFQRQTILCETIVHLGALGVVRETVLVGVGVRVGRGVAEGLGVGETLGVLVGRGDGVGEGVIVGEGVFVGVVFGDVDDFPKSQVQYMP